jgi:NNP family nitrate/nitrite transporter-like MFS transporter
MSSTAWGHHGRLCRLDDQPLPLIALALWHDSLAPILAFGLLLGFAGASFAVGVPFVNGWYPPERQGFALGVYGMGMGGSVLAGLTAPPDR